jgi:hypothetical protein
MCLALILLDIFSSKNSIAISSKNKVFVAFLSIFPDIDYFIDWMYGTNYHSQQSLPLFLSLLFLSVLYFATEKYRKVAFLCLTALGSQFFGDILVGSRTYNILAFRLHVIPGDFILFMASFEVIMPIIFFVFLLMKRIVVSGETEIIR